MASREALSGETSVPTHGETDDAIYERRVSLDLGRGTQLERHVLLKVIQRAFGQLGLKLTQKKLAQVVPVVGIAVSAGLNLNLLQDAHSAVQHAYRLRFLEEKYGLDSSTDFVVAGHGDGPATESSLSVDELLYAAIEEERGTLDDVPN